MDYTIVRTLAIDDKQLPKELGAINGGIAKRKDYFPSPSLSIDIDDIVAALTKVKEAGGSVVQEKTAIVAMGFSTIFKDTKGNFTGLWQSTQASAA